MTQQRSTFLENIVNILCGDRKKEEKKMYVENIYCRSGGEQDGAISVPHFQPFIYALSVVS